ncbi:MAG: efflux RND transporter periplasmic adaptor subunit [Candidatus Mcinerneyibacterium aminivorans]|uniref:Efflux RND transporter periplasmic adaptor subunit n=1 Tax=Candidatus Mcinerneyibacterium aminivorans TaxID=2703815 RepID=A0A5D0MJS0_9BACT|nr:MAG: efflux RND transporter periplasmic adaptor subunit [Candidatus Mcinerneyibacterium aminivorans]
MKKISILFITILLVFTISCSKKKSKAKTDSKPFVSVEKVQKRTILEFFETSGTLKGSEEVDVFSKVSGKLIEYKVEEGSHVEKNQVIALVDRDVTGVEYKPAKIKSPISGILVKNYMDKGTMITPGQMPVSKVSDMTNVVLEISLPEKYFSQLKRNLKVDIKVDSFPNEEFEGSISNFSPVVEQFTHTVNTEIQIPNSNLKLRSGMFARASILFDKRKVISVPQQAIVGENHIYIYEDGKVHIKKIKKGYLYKEYVEIKEGLEEGQNIVTVGHKLLKDGLEVRVR